MNVHKRTTPIQACTQRNIAPAVTITTIKTTQKAWKASVLGMAPAVATETMRDMMAGVRSGKTEH